MTFQDPRRSNFPGPCRTPALVY